MKKLRVLVTCGATWAPIDQVRVISNVSSGEMGHLIACAFRQKGADVTIIEGPVTHTLSCSRQGGNPFKIIKYRFFDELARILNEELARKYDIVVHAAAVSDFRVRRVSKNKIASGKKLRLDLQAAPKLIKAVKRLSPESFLVGFKLETSLNLKNIYRLAGPLFMGSGCDLVVANTLKGGYKGYVLDADGRVLSKAAGKAEMAKDLVGILTS
ncbi:MAG: phosphopantothenoylcysteine decarboxylase [Candidatus Omnitrophica bacterium]|nr:phosphopantothenoylcysteine decarboxylase [Candidatus Omnitrophota bacterium]MDE2010368.1 phosphopantothenoylcysteine decarboxylase [Candidatus Omnitrophota bacterium]MDE2215298.1 phosphopantothenoylcysteine decarboxylase [Candidatus Omnitrophota bacterium]MDE2232342.1 phosphopantothenoylcysteine decarboxylase [Candidatus Omnitrophota bacterium]